MSDTCRTCHAALGPLDETGEEERECIACWLRPRGETEDNQLELFGGERRAA